MAQTLRDAPVSGMLHLQVVQLGNALPDSLWHWATDVGVFVVVRYRSIEWRTVTRVLDRSVPTHDAANEVVFGHTKDIPIADDDPDSPIRFELWAARGQGKLVGKCRRLGCIEVPLFSFGRNTLQDFKLSFRDPALAVVGHEESFATGTVSVLGFFDQPFQSLLLPRPVLPSHAKWHIVDLPVKAQLMSEILFYLFF